MKILKLWYVVCTKFEISRVNITFQNYKFYNAQTQPPMKMTLYYFEFLEIQFQPYQLVEGDPNFYRRR